MTDGAITVEREGGRGVYRLALPGGEAARLTFVESASDHRIIDYSWVPPSLRGRGVARRLIEFVVADAREHGFAVTPVCGYVAAEFRRHPEWADVLRR